MVPYRVASASGPWGQGHGARAHWNAARGAGAQGTVLFHMDWFDRLLLQKFELGDEKFEYQTCRTPQGEQLL
jgi:hypothetical protein